MKRTNYFTLAALAVLSLAGCTQDDERAAGLPMTGMPLRPVVHVDAPVTREAMTTDDLTHYYFRATKHDESPAWEYNNFVEMTKGEDGQWTSEVTITWGTYYPKVSALEQKGVEWSQTDYTNGKTITLPTDQSDHDALLESDLLYMPPTNITAENLDDENNIKVNLAHRFAKLKVVVNVTGVPFNPIKSLVVDGTKTTVFFTPETGVLGEATNEATITAYIEDKGTSPYTYECILIPQELETSTLKVTATLQDGSSKSYTHDKALTLEGNCQYTLTLNMNHQGTLKPSGDVNVGNWGDKGEIGEGGELEEGAKIEGNTYYVSTARGLLEWARAIKEAPYPNLTLTKDIDMTGKTWPHIVYYASAIIDGGGYIISNLTLTEGGTSVGLIAGNAGCTIKNLTLQSPNIYASHFNGGFFIGGTASNCTIENCHVIGGTINGRSSVGGLANNANNSSFIACSVTSSGVDMICTESTMIGNPCSITACYVTGGKLVGSVVKNTPTYNASYYQNGGDITSGDGSTTATSWTEAATQMNTALSKTSYQWVENEEDDKAERPLVIKTQTTD